MLKLSRIGAVFAIAGGLAALASASSIPFSGFQPGNLILSRSVYEGTASTVTVGQPLPPNCPSGNSSCTTAIANGTYPGVWNNDPADGSFGVTSPVFLDQITTGGVLIDTLAIDPTQIVTSFSSKSELALNLSTDGTEITFMGYVGAGINTLDASNSNTLGVFDPTNPVGSSYDRGVAQVNAAGNLQVSETNAYCGNNGRAAILANGVYYTVGNSNNGSGTPDNVVGAAGAQFVTPSTLPLASQNPGTPLQVGSFSITQLGDKADKAGKDNNFRGLTIFNNTLYFTKGSGSNGIDTVYQAGSSGSLPTSSGAPWPINILPGFPTLLAKKAGATSDYPFGIWFANANTLYVADEGDGVIADAAGSPTAGLQKWIFDGSVWQLKYVLQQGLNLGQQYSIPNYPSTLSPATDGLRNITGRVNADGTVTVWAVTSTVSTNGDQGADPNELVMITDTLANTSATAAAGERFIVLRTAKFGEVLRGVSFTPGTVGPTAPALPVTSSGLVYSRATKTFTGTVTVTNNSSSQIAGPLTVVLTNLTAGVTLNNALSVSGNPGVRVLNAGSTLNPGQSETATVVFSVTSPSVSISYTTNVVDF